MVPFEKTFLFYDIETTGLNKAFDQVIQFAAIRTDLELNELARYEYLVRLNCDVVPSPSAFMTHRFSISMLEKGMTELEAIKKIHELFNTPGTISIGYNSLGFDDEFLRFSFYRNLLPPYTHQFANQCSRMDLYPMTVMYYLYKKSVITWPENNLKLENISKLNNLQSGMAHNAMVDVAATLKLAQHFRKELDTWNYLSGFFNKQIDLERCQQAIKINNTTDFSIMIDGKFGIAQHYQAPAISLGTHQYYKNQLVWLRVDVDNLLQADENNFQEHCVVINKKIGEPSWVLPKKERFFRSYLLQQQHKIKKTLCFIENSQPLLKKIANHYLTYTYPKITQIDAGAALYDKGFITTTDQEICKKIHLATPKHKLNYASFLSEQHLQELLIRLIGRHFPEYLQGKEKNIFDCYMQHIKSSATEDFYLDYRGQKRLTPQNALLEIEQISKTPLDEEQKKLLLELKTYINQNFLK